MRPPLPETNPNVRKNDVTEKRKRATPKKKFRPSTGKTSGNLFEDRNWLLPKNYLVTENRNESTTGVTSPRPPLKEEPKREEQVISPKAEKCRWGPRFPFLQVPKEGRRQQAATDITKCIKTSSQKTQYLKPVHD